MLEGRQSSRKACSRRTVRRGCESVPYVHPSGRARAAPAARPAPRPHAARQRHLDRRQMPRPPAAVGHSQPQGFRRPRRAREAGDRTDPVTRAWSRMRQADHPWHGSWHGSWHEHGDIRKGAKDRRDLVKAPGGNSGTLERMPGPGLRRRERRFESCRGHQPAKGMRRSNAHQGAAAGGEPANAQVTGSQCGCPWGIGHRTVRPVAAEGPDAVIVVRRSARNTAAGAQPSTILHISATRDLPHDAPQSARRTPSDEHGWHLSHLHQGNPR